MAISKEICESFRTDFAAMSKLFEAKYGLRLDLGRITYNMTELRVKLTGTDMSAQPAKTSVYGVAVHVPAIGIKFKFPGKQAVYTVMRINERASKNKIQVQTDRGARYVLSLEQYQRAIIVTK